MAQPGVGRVQVLGSKKSLEKGEEEVFGGRTVDPSMLGIGILEVG